MTARPLPLEDFALGFSRSHGPSDDAKSKSEESCCDGECLHGEDVDVVGERSINDDRWEISVISIKFDGSPFISAQSYVQPLTSLIRMSRGVR